jgi:hypothetical protein
LKLEDQDDLWLAAVRMRDSSDVDISSLKLEGFENVKELIRED